MRPELLRVLVVVALCAPMLTTGAQAVVAHRDAPFHEHGIGLAKGLHFGYPAMLSAGVGASVGLGDRSRGAVVGLVEPGMLARRYTAGYRMWQTFFGTGVGVRATNLRPWTEAPGMPRGSSFVGGELLVHAFQFGVRAGAFRGSARDGSQLRLATFDLAFGM